MTPHTSDPLVHIRIPEPLLTRLDHLSITLYGHNRHRRSAIFSMVLALGLEHLSYGKNGAGEGSEDAEKRLTTSQDR